MDTMKRHPIFAVFQGFFGRDEASTCAERGSMKRLRAAIFLGTVENDFNQKDAMNALYEVLGIVNNSPRFIDETVRIIKTRIKDRCAVTSCSSIEFLDMCLQINGASFRSAVSKLVLGRVLKLAMPHMGTHPRIQITAAAAVYAWSATYSHEQFLAAFRLAADKLMIAEPPTSVIAARRRSSCYPVGPPVATTSATQMRVSLGCAAWNNVLSLAAPPHSIRARVQSSAETSTATAASTAAAMSSISILTDTELMRIARASQCAIAAQTRGTRDRALLRELRALHDQQEEDIQAYCRGTGEGHSCCGEGREVSA